MKTLINLIQSFRLSVSIPAALLVHVGFNISYQPTNWLLVATVLIGCASTMLQNDYFDKEHDKKKQKCFVSENSKLIFLILILMWSTVLGIIWLRLNDKLILSLLTFIGLSYSFARHVLLFPSILVSLASAFPVLLPSIHIMQNNNLILFIGVASAIFGRELLKDIEDKLVDSGYKKTLLSESIITEKFAHRLASLCILAGIICNLCLLKYLNAKGLILCIAGTILLTVSIELNLSKRFLL